MIRRTAAAILITGTLASAGIIAAQASSHSATALTATATGKTAAAATSVAGTKGQGPGGGHGGLGGFGGPGGHGGFTVTAISGNTITANGPNGTTVTITVTSSTTYSEAGTTATLSDIHVGSIIAVRQASMAQGSTTLTATSIMIQLPSTGGVVSSVSGDTITVTGRDQKTYTIVVSAITRYQKAGKTASLTDVAKGTSIMAEGALSGATLSAQLVTIQVPRLGGQVTAVNGTAITVKGRDGATDTVNVSADTTYVNADGTAATVASVKVGVNINAEGTLSSDGKTLTALRVTILPVGMGNGGPGGGGHGAPPSDTGSSGSSAA
jgi:endonuclease YncB( thermonuclease family)